MTDKPNKDNFEKYLNYFAATGAVGIMALVVLFWPQNQPLVWTEETIVFESGQRCYVFLEGISQNLEPKFVVFFGDEDDAIFDRVADHDFAGFNIGGGGNFRSVYTIYTSRRGGMTMEFDNTNCVMVLSERGTKLTLSDGREFLLDGPTPLWLRYRPDGTIVVLDEIPQGFIDFFENPPPDPGFLRNVAVSWPEAFR